VNVDPKVKAYNARCPKFTHNFKTVQGMMSITILIVNSKSHTVFRLVPTSVALNDLERRNILYCALFYRIR